jgi:hypothetical protein
MSVELPAHSRLESCPPSFVVEAASAGEPLSREQRAHLDGCERCGAYERALKEAAAAYVAQRPPEMFLRQLDRRERRVAARNVAWRWVTAASVVAAAGITVMVGQSRQDEAPAGVRLKGGETLGVIVRGREGGEPRPLAAEERARAGETLRFTFEAPDDGQLLVVAWSGGDPVVVFPERGTHSASVGPGTTLLPGAVVLDDAPGPDWVIAVFAADPVSVSTVARQLGSRSNASRPELSCDGCTVSVRRVR